MSPGTMQCENNGDGKCAGPFAASSSTSLGNRCTLNVTSSKSRTQCQADATHKECFLQSRFSVVIEKLVSGYGPPCGLQGILHSTCYNFRQCYEAHIRRRPSVNNFSVLTRTKASPNTEGKKKSKPSTCSIMRKRDATSPNVTTYYLNW